MRVAYYVRVSTAQQVQTQTIDQQIARLQTYVQEHGWPWQAEYLFRDDGYSGSSLRRPGLDRLRDKVAEAYFDQLLVTAPDRLARQYVHQMLLVEEFEKAGCEVTFLERPMSKDPNDQLLLQIRGAVSEYERTLIAERLRRGRQHKYRSGQLLPWTAPPYGYVCDPAQPRRPEGVRLDAAAAAIVAEIFAWYLAPGGNLSVVAKRLAAAGIPSPTGRSFWRPQSVRVILKNPVYMGKVYAGRSQVRLVRRRRSPLAPVGKRPYGKAPTAPEEWIFVGDVPAIVSQEQFEQVQAKFKVNQQRARRNNKVYPYLLRSMVSCGLCRGTCRGQTSRRHAYYVCTGKNHQVQSGREELCPSRLIPMSQLDAVVWHDLCEVLTHPSIITHALQRAQAGQWLPQEMQARQENLRRAQRSLAQQVDRLTEAYLGGVMGLDEYQRRRRDLEERIAALERQSRELAAQVDRQAEIAGWAGTIEAFCQRVQLGLEHAGFEEKRQLVEMLIDRVVVTNAEVEIRYVIPLSPRSECVRFYQLRTDYCRTLQQKLRPGMPQDPST